MGCLVYQSHIIGLHGLDNTKRAKASATTNIHNLKFAQLRLEMLYRNFTEEREIMII